MPKFIVEVSVFGKKYKASIRAESRAKAAEIALLHVRAKTVVESINEEEENFEGAGKIINDFLSQFGDTFINAQK